MKRKHGLSVKERIERHRVVEENGCWTYSLSKRKAYPEIKVAGKQKFVHRLAFETYVGVIPDGLYVLHHCDNPRCHNPEHLYAGTLSDNMRDMWSRGRHEPPVTKFNEKLIFALHADGKSQKEIAAQVGTGQTAISYLLRKAKVSRGKNTSFNKHLGQATRVKRRAESDCYSK